LSGIWGVRSMVGEGLSERCSLEEFMV